MKKILAIITAALMLLSLYACSASGINDGVTDKTPEIIIETPEITVEAPETPKVTPEEKDPAVEPSKPETPEKPKTEKPKEPEKKETPIREKIYYSPESLAKYPNGKKPSFRSKSKDVIDYILGIEGIGGLSAIQYAEYNNSFSDKYRKCDSIFVEITGDFEEFKKRWENHENIKEITEPYPSTEKNVKTTFFNICFNQKDCELQKKMLSEIAEDDDVLITEASFFVPMNNKEDLK